MQRIIKFAPLPSGSPLLGPLDALDHVVNLLLPALGVGAIGAGLAKLDWRRELSGVRWTRLAASAVAAGACVTVAGLILFGHDGRMETYGAMVLAASLALLWAGFGRGR
jgi:hypothetical protein